MRLSLIVHIFGSIIFFLFLSYMTITKADKSLILLSLGAMIYFILMTLITYRNYKKNKKSK
ncbi:hypothetical protein BMT55_06185 [Listeria newyorkensis]|uniref:Uncharacterized protein n=1 Tax=Listeria newyorkensis TaxID=1497681 RepID=A0ABX4XP97_9LIST|nr:hypothetical protein EP56_12900 [Listeriaceae bacterium FSL A5-0209]KGL46489.1 hypothetical protein EP58_01590 [Listeria newyorkensis]PNP93012.1 hypothetical protein BMT55_06185 [Listeria newyorkensis]RQW67005.1 hypothetical protein DUK53_07375 [Listeria sp. SHR_NRA_18]SQC56427.1 Uncharacterised protein [Listeria newyorkensis]